MLTFHGAHDTQSGLSYFASFRLTSYGGNEELGSTTFRHI